MRIALLLFLVGYTALGVVPEAGPDIPASAPDAAVIDASEPTAQELEEQMQKTAPDALAPIEVSPSSAVLEMKPAPAPKGEKLDKVQLHVRIDTNFSAGGPSQQGFSIPSIRLSAYGGVNDHLRYRLSMAGTREFSSVLMPQLMPVEAYVELTSLKNGETATGTVLAGRMGMFTPTFNPWWSPDLSDLSQPDYFDVHRAAFIFRDIGAEIKLSSYGTGLELSAGFFNGNGILALNTNNSKTVIGSASYGFEVGKVSARVGTAGYTLVQSGLGSINYKSNWVGDVFFSLASLHARNHIQVDVFTGKFEDSTRSITPSGVTVAGAFEVSPSVQFFARWENISESPRGSNQVLTHFQAGPVLWINENLKAFTYFDYQDLGDSGIENSLQVRLRLTL